MTTRGKGRPSKRAGARSQYGSSSCLAPCPTLFEPRRNQEILAGTVCLVVVMNSPISLQQHVVLLFSHDLWHLEQPQSTARKRNTRFVSVSGALGWVLDEFWSSSAEQREGGSMPGA